MTNGAGRVLLYALTALSVASPAGVAAQLTVGHARTVLAAVVSGQGRPLVDVGLDDFVVTEGAQPRPILDVHVADYPLAIIVDDRAVATETLAVVRDATRRFIERVGERPVALFRLTSPSAVADLDSDRTNVLTRLARVEATGADAASPPLDTIARAAAVLQASGAPFSGVVVIAGAPVDASALVRGELLPAIQSSGAAVHVVQAQLPGATPTADAPDLLHVIADQTRGQFTPIFTAASFPAALDRLADRLAVEMMVQYEVPDGPKAGDVRVGVRIPGARVVGLGVK